MRASTHIASSIREQAAQVVGYSARTAFAALLFFSPFALHRTLESRPVGNIFSSYTDFLIYASDVCMVLALALWGLLIVLRWRRITLGPPFLTWPLVALVALSWVGAKTGLDPRLTLYQSIRFSLLLGLYLFLVNERSSPIWVALPLGLGVLLQAITAIMQFTGQHSLGWGAWGELALDPKVPGTSILVEGNVRILRGYGLTEHPNILGGFFAVALLLMLGYYVSRTNPRLVRYSMLLPLALGGTGLFVTFSRSAAVAFLVGAALLCPVVVWSVRKNIRSFLALAFAVLVMVLAVAVPLETNSGLVAERIGEANSFAKNALEERSLAERQALLESAARIFLSHEAVGVGNGALPLAVFKLDRQFPKQYNFQPAHFILLDAAAELGVLGGIVWLWLLAVPMVALWGQRRVALQDPWLVATVAALLSLTVIGFFDYYPWLSVPGRVWQWSAWGLFAAAYKTASDSGT